MTFCALFMVSCQRPVTESSSLEVSVKTPVVDSGKGQMFVNVKCDGRWTLALTDAVDGKDVDWASLSVTSGSDNKSNVVLSYQVNASEQSRKLDIVLDDGLHWVACSVEQMGAGKQPEPEPDPAPDTELPKTGWLELPAMDDPGLGYYSHSFKMNGKTYRNYSFGWSQEDRVALWVGS